ncbi:a disintegrin and metalloproteinase with thrombospondin motifs 16 [Trichonephila inaurata madagascariensis]|uniref:A disintegrin and metalloproteinase with thrombospondin motifs 16 n=1 Tax=Trichonephila inaurata madagascariensis TaxID=2747483 RepID=A0A8X6YVY7_9ARAC|nr:a disintegrin and metalloproteinase with thrombospondin motifs 16 [Trichonephila inaurata madagascariensis]
MPVLSFWTLTFACAVVWVTPKQGFCMTDISDEFAEVTTNIYDYFEQESVIPIEVDDDGHPLTHIRTKRDAGSKQRKYYSFEGFGEHFHLEMEASPHLLAPGFKVYRLGDEVNTPAENQVDREDLESCLFRGKLKDHPNSAFALNLCGGMSGFLKTETSDYLIEPENRNVSDPKATEKPHVLKRRSVSSNRDRSSSGQSKNKRKNQTFFCGKRRRYMPHKPRRKDYWLPDEFTVVKGYHNAASKQRIKRWSRKETFPPENRAGDDKRHHHRRNQRSIETLVVADREMVKKHGTENVTTYLLTVFNMVAMLYQDATIGNNVSVILVGLVLLEGDEPGLTLSHNAENSLSSFCQWQSTIHTAKGRQHDHAVLVTGLDICSWKDEPCDTLGYAPISGMCSKYRSCTKQRSPRSLCLTNEPDSPDELQFPDHLPGQLYDADMQCRLQFGAKSKLCEHYPRKNEVCRALWCQRNGGRECETKFLPAAEGTPCGKNKWCRKGSCVNRQTDTQAIVDGGWSPFSQWSNCSRPCGGGLMIEKKNAIPKSQVMVEVIVKEKIQNIKYVVPKNVKTMTRISH